MWSSVQFRNRVCGGALCVQRVGFWRFDRCSHGDSVKFVASVCSILANYGSSDFVSLFQVQLVMVHVSPGLAMYRLKRK